MTRYRIAINYHSRSVTNPGPLMTAELPASWNVDVQRKEGVGRPGISFDEFGVRVSVIFGSLLIAFGVISIVLNGIAFAFGDVVAVYCHGFCCGITYILTGLCGVASRRKSLCTIILLMTFALIAAPFSAYQLAIGILGAIKDSKASLTAAVAVESVLVVISVIACCLSICASVICCKAMCCRSSPTKVTLTLFENQELMVFSPQLQAYTGSLEPTAAQESTSPSRAPVYGSFDQPSAKNHQVQPIFQQSPSSSQQHQQQQISQTPPQSSFQPSPMMLRYNSQILHVYAKGTVNAFETGEGRKF